MKLALVFEELIEGTTGMYFRRACSALGLTSDHWRLREAASIPAGYDLYLRVDHGDGYTVELPAHCRPLAFYAIDTHLRHSWQKIQRIAPSCDMVFCCHADGARRLRAEWLPVACDPDIHGSPVSEPVWDIGFVGSEGGVPRKFYLQALRERYPNHRIGGYVYSEMASIYSRAKIGFNYAIAEDVNMRVFEVLAAGTLLVTNAINGDDFHRLGLEDRRHLVFYRSPRELFELIDYYLAHPADRTRIARIGQQLVLERHTYAHRMKQLLTSVSRRLGVPLPEAFTTRETNTCVPTTQ